MRDKPKQDTQQPKKPYRKPVLSLVQLKSEEAVLGACKTNGFYGPSADNCAFPAGCWTLGS